MGVFSEWSVAERRLREFDEAHPQLEWCLDFPCPFNTEHPALQEERRKLVHDLQLAQWDAAAEANLDAAADAEIEGSE